MKHSDNPVIQALVSNIKTLDEATYALTEEYSKKRQVIEQAGVQFFFRAMPVRPVILDVLNENMPALTVINLLTKIKTSYVQYHEILKNQNGIMSETIKTHHVATPPNSPTLSAKRSIDESTPSSSTDQVSSSISGYKKPTSPTESLKHLLTLQERQEHKRTKTV